MQIRTAVASEKLLDVAFEAASTQVFLDRSAEIVAASFSSPLALIRVESHGERVEVTWRDPDQRIEQWLWVARAVIMEASNAQAPTGRLLHTDPSVPRVLAIAAPVRNRDLEHVGAVSVFAKVEDEALETEMLEELAVLTAVIGAGLEPSERAGAVHDMSGAQSSDRGADDSALLLADADARAARYASVQEFAFALSNSLRERSHSLQASIGIERGSRVEILSISDVDSLRPQAAGTASLRQAMAECIDAGMPVVAQDDESSFDADSVFAGAPLHTAWRGDVGHGAVLSVPVSTPHGPSVVVSVARDRQHPFSPDDLAGLITICASVGSSIALLRRAERGLWRHARDSVRGLVAGRGHVGRLLVWLLLTAFLLWFAFGTMTHRIVVPCTLAARQVVHLAAPFEGRIAENYAEEGTRLSASAIACKLDTTDLELARAQTQADMHALDLEVQQAVAAGDRSLASILAARHESMRHQVTALERKIASAALRMPADGVILRGDLSKRIGQIVPQGETLYEVVPDAADGTRLELRIPEDYASDIQPGDHLTFASRARPEIGFTYVVRWIRPAAETHDAENVFVARAELVSAERSDWLRVGMEGVAKIELGSRPVWRVVFDRALRFVHSEFWL